MALPTVAINSGTGSDTAASGAGPATAIGGVLAATHANTTVNITDAVALGGVAVDGSAVLWVGSSSGKQFAKITAISGTSGAWVVTVALAFANTESGKNWGIGGKRATLNGSLQLGLDCGAGWTVDLQTDDVLTANFRLTPLTPTSALPTTFTSTAVTRPVLSTSTNSVFGCDVQASSNLVISHINFRSTAGTPGNGIGMAGTAGNTKNLVVDDCIIDGFKWGLAMEDNGANNQMHGVIVQGCEIKNCTAAGIAAGSTGECPQVADCYVHNNTGPGLSAGQGFGCKSVSIVRSVFAFNTSYGATVNLVDSQFHYFGNCDFSYNNTAGTAGVAGLRLNQNGGDGVITVENCIFWGQSTTAHGYGLAGTVTAFLSLNNAFGGNGEGARLAGVPAGANDVTLTVDPHVSTTDFYTNATAGGGAACRGAGYRSTLGSATAPAPDIGVYQQGGAAAGGPVAGNMRGGFING